MTRLLLAAAALVVVLAAAGVGTPIRGRDRWRMGGGYENVYMNVSEC